MNTEFSQNQTAAPDYAGHIMQLDVERAYKWQTWNFFVSTRCPIAEVPAKTATFPDKIHQAVQDGILVDLTEHPELYKGPKRITDVDDPNVKAAPLRETDSGIRVFANKRSFFRALDLDDDPQAPADEYVTYGTSDPDERGKIEKALRDSNPKCLVLPPGMDDPERYALKV